MKGKRLIVAIVGSVIAIAAFWYFSQPRTYADCILKMVPKANSARAAEYIEEACTDKFLSD